MTWSIAITPCHWHLPLGVRFEAVLGWRILVIGILCFELEVGW